MCPCNLNRGGVIPAKKYMINRGQPLKRRSGFANTEGGRSTRGGDNCLPLIRLVVNQYAGHIPTGSRCDNKRFYLTPTRMMT